MQGYREIRWSKKAAKKSYKQNFKFTRTLQWINNRAIMIACVGTNALQRIYIVFDWPANNYRTFRRLHFLEYGLNNLTAISILKIIIHGSIWLECTNGDEQKTIILYIVLPLHAMLINVAWSLFLFSLNSKNKMQKKKVTAAEPKQDFWAKKGAAWKYPILFFLYTAIGHCLQVEKTTKKQLITLTPVTKRRLFYFQ